MEARLPAHLTVNALIRRVQAEGGFAMVLASGERDAGTLLIVTAETRGKARLYERMPQPDGERRWTLSRQQDPEKPEEFDAYLQRRQSQDPDAWIVELDIRDPERFIGSGDHRG